MSITKVNLDESTNLQFELVIEGVREKVSEIRLVVEAGSYKVGFDGVLDNGVLSVDIPVLENVVPAGERKCHLEIVADQKFFVPLKDTIEFVAPIRIESAVIGKKEIKEEVKVTAKATTTKVTKQVKLQEQTFEQIVADKKLKLVESRDFVYAKDENDKYVGTMSKETKRFTFYDPVSLASKAGIPT